MNDDPQIFQARSHQDILEESTILALRQLGDNLKVTNATLVRIGDKMEEVYKKVTVIEAQEWSERWQEVKTAIKEAESERKHLADRVARLESDKDQRQGAAAFVRYAAQVGPWIIGLIGAILAYNLKHVG